eukprot:7006866-Prymnesium_polylepis.1
MGGVRDCTFWQSVRASLAGRASAPLHPPRRHQRGAAARARVAATALAPDQKRTVRERVIDVAVFCR